MPLLKDGAFVLLTLDLGKNLAERPEISGMARALKGFGTPVSLTEEGTAALPLLLLGLSNPYHLDSS